MPFILSYEIVPTSIDCDLLSCLMLWSMGPSEVGGAPQCCASSDLLSSMGVNMLLDFACEIGLGCGRGGL